MFFVVIFSTLKRNCFDSDSLSTENINKVTIEANYALSAFTTIGSWPDEQDGTDYHDSIREMYHDTVNVVMLNGNMRSVVLWRCNGLCLKHHMGCSMQ